MHVISSVVRRGEETPDLTPNLNPLQSQNISSPLSPNYTANDMQQIAIEKVFSNRDSIRKAREAFLILRGKTIDPDGLNIREETY